jgi:hypothetical protein
MHIIQSERIGRKLPRAMRPAAGTAVVPTHQFETV